MKYNTERVLISKDGEIFRVGDFLTIVYSKCFINKTISGRLHRVDLEMFSDMALIDISEKCISDIKAIPIDDISSVKKSMLEDISKGA